MSTLFPSEIIALFARSRCTLLAIRCSCRRFLALTAQSKWEVEVIGGGRDNWIEVLYRSNISFAPPSDITTTVIFAEDRAVALYAGNWEDYNEDLRRRYIFECGLVGVGPMVPAAIKIARSSLSAKRNTRYYAIMGSSSCTVSNCNGQTFVTTTGESLLDLDEIVDDNGRGLVIFAVMKRASRL